MDDITCARKFKLELLRLINNLENKQNSLVYTGAAKAYLKTANDFDLIDFDIGPRLEEHEKKIKNKDAEFFLKMKIAQVQKYIDFVNEIYPSLTEDELNMIWSAINEMLNYYKAYKKCTQNQ